MSDKPQSDFEQLAADHSSGSFAGELWQFLRHNRKWWLLPMLAVLLLFAVALLLSSTAAAPFIYTLF